MKCYKVFALVYRDFRIFRNMKYKSIELFYFPVSAIIIWGLFATFVRDSALEAGLIVLVIQVFWSFAHSAQSATNVSMMEDVWSGSLKHIFVSGISSTEYMLARMISSAINSVIMVMALLGLSHYVFGVQLIASEFPAVMGFIALTLIASLALAVLVAGMILSMGREYGFLAWTAMEAFILLSAPFYPASIFPGFVQPITWVMPFTNVFEGMRLLVTSGVVDAGFLINGAVVSLGYLIISFPFYTAVFRRAKRNGNLVRMGS